MVEGRRVYQTHWRFQVLLTLCRNACNHPFDWLVRFCRNGYCYRWYMGFVSLSTSEAILYNSPPGTFHLRLVDYAYGFVHEYDLTSMSLLSVYEHRYMLSFNSNNGFRHEFIKANRNGYRLVNFSAQVPTYQMGWLNFVLNCSLQVFPSIKSLIHYFRKNVIRGVKLTNGRGDFGASYRALLAYVVELFMPSIVVMHRDM